MKRIAAVCLLFLAPLGSATEKDFQGPPVAAHRRPFKALMSRPQTFGRYDALILKHAQDHHLNPRMVKSMIAAESEFYDGAVSPKGARGLMQIMPITAEEMGVPRSRLRDPDSNLRAGTAYLEVLCGRARIIYKLKGAGCLDAPLWVQERVVAAYHAGPRMLHHDSEGWPPATRLYVQNVFLYYHSPATALARPHPIHTAPKRMQRLLAKL
jgi:soluble lytic murein transglycosylase-like protein